MANEGVLFSLVTLLVVGRLKGDLPWALEGRPSVEAIPALIAKQVLGLAPAYSLLLRVSCWRGIDSRLS